MLGLKGVSLVWLVASFLGCGLLFRESKGFFLASPLVIIGV